MDYYYKPGEKVEGLSILKIIGEGRYGIAYLAVNSQGTAYVIKQLKKKMLKTTRDKLFYEQKILKQLHSAHFPQFIGTFHHHHAEGYILEYKAGKVFEDLVVQDNLVFTPPMIYATAYRLLNLIEILQQSHIVHRDIRLPNVILSDTGELVLIDFGLARFIDNRRYVKQMDYWYLGDFLLHLYYTAYQETSPKDRPWYEELPLSEGESYFLKRLMGLERDYDTIHELRLDLRYLRHAL